MNKTFDENRVSGTWLQIDTYDNNDNCIIKEFEVPKWWLKKQIEEEYKTVENFLNEYTSDESGELYALAQLNDVILCEINR